MHLAEFLSGPNKRRDRRRLRAKNATRTTDASFLRSHFSLCAPLGPRRGRERERERRPIPHHRRLHRVASVNRQKLLSIPRMYSTPPLPSPPFTLASSAPWTGTLLRIRYVNREDDNRTETDDGSRAGARSFEAPSPPPLLPLPFTFSSAFYLLHGDGYAFSSRSRYHLDRSPPSL